MSGHNMPRGVERRGMNIVEGLILAALVALGALIFSMNDSVTRLQATVEPFKAKLDAMPALEQRVSRNEVRVENLEEGLRELRQTKGLQ